MQRESASISMMQCYPLTNWQSNYLEILFGMKNMGHSCDTIFLTLRADNSVVRGFGMGDRSSFFHKALIEPICFGVLP